jgi:hypothetical protein
MFVRNVKIPPLDTYDPASLAHFVAAALCSPAANHRSPALAIVLDRALRARRLGNRIATAADLPRIVEAVYTAIPDLWSLTDTVPQDPRVDTVLRWRSELFQLHPGFVERPIAMVRKAELVARAVDPVLRPFLAFGVGDVLDLLLRYADRSYQGLSPHWTVSQPSDVATSPTITAAELAAYSGLPALPDLCDSCTNAAAARRALDYLTVQARSLDFAIDRGTAIFGTAGRVVRKRDALDFSMPPCLVPELIEAAAARLALQALEREPGLEHRFQQVLASYVERLLWRLRRPIHRVLVERGLRWAVHIADRTWLIIAIIGSLAEELPSEQLEACYDELCAQDLGDLLRAAGADVLPPADVRVSHLLVLGVPHHVTVFGGGAVIPIEDLDWITHRLRGDADAFLHFCRELAGTSPEEHLLAFETINLFEHWMGNGQSVHRAGVQVSLVVIEPHQGAREWLQAAEDAPFERALHALRFPRLEAWAVREPLDNSVELLDPRRGLYLLITPGTAPFAVSAVFGDFSDELRSSVEFVARGIRWKLCRVTGEFLDGSFALRVRLVEINAGAGEPVTLVASYASGEGLIEVSIGLSARALELMRTNAEEFERLFGVNLSAGIASARSEWTAASFQQAWSDAPQGIRVDALRRRCVVQHHQPPQRPDPAVRARILQRLAERLVSQGVPVGRLVGEEVCAFETEIVSPALRELLHTTMSAYEATGLLDFALSELERVHGHRFYEETRLALRQRFPVAAVDPLAETGRIIDDATRITRAIEIVVEELLQRLPAGSSSPDRLDWREVLTIADLMLDSAFRSEQAHLRLQSIAVEIDEVRQISVKWDGEPADADLEALNQAAIRHARIGPDVTADEVSPENDEYRSLDEGLPQFSATNAAMRQELSFSLETLIRTVSSLQAWPVTNESPFAWATRADIVRFCLEDVQGPVSEIEAALDFLSIDSARLGAGVLEHWEQERRAVRLANRPLIRRGSGELALGPWTLRGFARRLSRYLEAGRLIWPDKSLPGGVVEALQVYRSERNRQLERETLDRARSLSLKCVAGVKKPRLIGLDHLPGEIDVLAIDAARGTIWVIEAKDPFEAFSYAQLRYQLDRFHRDDRLAYVAKLLAKTTAVREGATQVAAAMGITAALSWEVIPLIVTRHPTVAAFVPEPRVQFATLEELPGMLARHDTLLA